PGEWLPLYLLAQVELEQGAWQAAVATLERVTGAAAKLEEVRSALAATRARPTGAGALVRRFAGHTDWVSSVCATPDGRFALSGSADGTLRFWDVAAGRCLATFHEHAEWVTAAALSADGRYALSGSADRTLKFWETASGRCLGTLQGHTNWVLGAALSP